MLKTIKEIRYEYIALGIILGFALKFALNKWKEKKN